MSAITTLGGVIGVFFIGVVIVVGLLPLVFIKRKNELKEPESDLKLAHDRMSVHI